MQPSNECAPDWVPTEMPAGYRTRLAEIQRLSKELGSMDGLGRLLWRIGDDLLDAVHEAFIALGFEAELTPGASIGSVTTVKLGARERLLLHVSETTGIIQRKSAEVARSFQIFHELAEDTDRVVLVTNTDPRVRPADRLESIGPEALSLLQRLGTNVLPGPTMFALWMLSLQDVNRARTHVERLHAQDGGLFLFPLVEAR